MHSWTNAHRSGYLGKAGHVGVSQYIRMAARQPNVEPNHCSTQPWRPTIRCSKLSDASETGRGLVTAVGVLGARPVIARADDPRVS